MSVQGGSWIFDSRGREIAIMDGLRSELASYGPDGGDSFRDDEIEILFRGFHETQFPPVERQPFCLTTGQVLTWDGRLDNREDLARELSGSARSFDSDLAIVAASVGRWGPACLPKLVGDWALSLWDPGEHELLLAKDFLGTRSLFYSVGTNRVQWSSILDPLVLSAGNPFSLNREYLAGWFGTFPAANLTPYVGIYAVPPGSVVRVRKQRVRIEEFWQFRERHIRYRCDSDYEEHFRQLFEQSVRRRLRSPAPVLAELSGGMDSSSIVCVADRVLMWHGDLTPRLDTISYYSPGEPNWDELPYVAKVEELRGHEGIHLQLEPADVFPDEGPSSYFMATPGSLQPVGKRDFEFRQILRNAGYRVVLSGIGGDEVLGGVPTPTPLFADLVLSGRWRSLAHTLFAWAVALRTPLISLLRQTLAAFFPPRFVARGTGTLAWLSPRFQKEHKDALRGYARRWKFFGARPSFQDNLQTLEALRRQLASYPLPAEPAYRKLYPYLDRDLLEFLFAIPPDQLLRPGQRRSLMRRALKGIVPEELLHRKRKGFVIRGPLKAIASEQARLSAIAEEMLSSALGITDSASLIETLRDVGSGGTVALPSIVRVFAIEHWLRNVAHWKVLKEVEARTSTSTFPAKAKTASRSRGFKSSLS